MNVYDAAHDLSAAIKASNEYKEFHELSEEVKKDEELYKMLSDMQAKQFEIQAAQVTGSDVSQELMSQVQSMYTMMAGKPVALKYMEAQMRFSMMMKDVFEILGDSMDFKI